jgi:integrase
VSSNLAAPTLNHWPFQATRHTAVSRALKAGVPLDEVAAAFGHSSPEVTARHYAHFVRKSFAPGLRLPMP